MHQLILGSDIALRDKIIHELKARFLKTPDALKFDLTQIDGQGLDFNDLKAALLTVPAVSSRRLILIGHGEKLSDRNLELIDHVVSDSKVGCVLVIEALSWDKRSALRKRLAEKIKVSGGDEALSAFDLLYDLARDRGGVLVRLQKLLEEDAVENVLGALRWWWTHKVKGTVSAASYKKGLLVVQEADERIKLSGMLLREQTIETALVKLSLLLKA
ncbi:MAG: hypothetical protein HQL17_00720 [Candidatus Omnitrophica bacterium]|nr:hypothetical protein [Candidatus Omnitrophota bacterium]